MIPNNCRNSNLVEVAAKWPEQGSRHSAFLALIGGLLREGWDAERVEAFVSDLCDATGDEEAPLRLAIIKNTAERLQKNEPCQGWPKLGEIIGKEAALSIRVALDCALTVDALASAKQLPSKFLRGVGVEDGADHAGHVTIPYKNASGETIAIRRRKSFISKPLWEKGAKALAYGEDRLGDAVNAGYLILVEGESDCWTLWHSAFHALGIPGSECTRVLQAGHVSPFSRLFVVQEADNAGERFVDGVAQRLALLGWAGELRVIRMEDKAKDVSALFLSDAQAFKEEWRKRIDGAEKIALPKVDAVEEETNERTSQAARLIELAKGRIELFHTSDGVGYASTKDKPRQTLRIDSRAMRGWLRRLLYDATEEVATGITLSDVIDHFDGLASIIGEEQEVYLRVAGDKDGKTFIDLGAKDWRAVALDGAGWRVVDDVPVSFYRTQSGTLALPEPQRGGSLDDLKLFINIGSEDDWRLLVAWLCMCFRPQGPYPVLCLSGEQGSAKSSTAKVLRALIDPNKAPLRAEPKGIEDLMVAANGSWLLAFDNLSHLSPSLSDALCGLSTGRGFSTRKFYTNEDEIIFQACRPIVLTSIVDIAKREDLLDRSIILRLPTIPEEKRQSESELWPAFEKAKPMLLGALLDLVAGAMRHLPNVKLASKPRMADFATWGVAVERAAGWPEGNFLSAYLENNEEAMSLALDSLLPEKLRALVKPEIENTGEWKGTASKLLEELNTVVGDGARAKDWPKNAQDLSGKLKRIAPALRRDKDYPLDVQTGVKEGSGNDRKRCIIIKTLKPASERTEAPAPESGTAEASGDDPPKPSSPPIVPTSDSYKTDGPRFNPCGVNADDAVDPSPTSLTSEGEKNRGNTGRVFSESIFESRETIDRIDRIVPTPAENTDGPGFSPTESGDDPLTPHRPHIVPTTDQGGAVPLSPAANSAADTQTEMTPEDIQAIAAKLAQMDFFPENPNN